METSQFLPVYFTPPLYNGLNQAENTMRPNQKMIHDILGDVAATVNTRHIEALVIAEHGTTDSMSRNQFAVAVHQAMCDMQELDTKILNTLVRGAGC